MRKSVLVLLLVATILVANTEAGWFRKAVRKIKSGVKKAIDKVKTFVKTHGPTIVNAVGRVVGKRSVQTPCSPEQQQEEDTQRMQQMLEDLARSCPTFGIDPNVGLTAEAVQYAFQVSDEDKSGALDPEELGLFENIMDTYEECVLMEQAKRK